MSTWRRFDIFLSFLCLVGNPFGVVAGDIASSLAVFQRLAGERVYGKVAWGIRINSSASLLQLHRNETAQNTAGG